MKKSLITSGPGLIFSFDSVDEVFFFIIVPFIQLSFLILPETVFAHQLVHDVPNRLLQSHICQARLR